MEKYIVAICLWVFVLIPAFKKPRAFAFGQNIKYQYHGRFTAEVQAEKLKEARFLNQIMPEFTKRFILPYKESVEFRDLTSVVNKPTQYYNYPQGNYLHLRENYETIIDYVAIEIAGQNEGSAVSAKSTDDILTAAQRKIINAADPGSEIFIKIKFRYKPWVNATYKSGEDIKEGTYTTTVVPDMEAEFPGGIDQLSAFIGNNIFNKVSGGSQLSKLLSSIVKFTINESGRVEDIRFTKSSNDLKIDTLILNAISKMPKWKPAKDSKGVSVKQEFTIPFDSSVGC